MAERTSMGLLILLFIIGLPLVEIYLFIEVGDELGALSTVGLTILTAVVGMALVRSQGLSVLRSAQASAERGETPVKEALHGVALLLAGIFLFIPGFFTDALGALLLIPMVREVIGLALLSKVIVARANTGNRQGGGFADDSHTVDAEFEDITPGQPRDGHQGTDPRQIDQH
jgi:UPF0716 protein FxsA